MLDSRAAIWDLPWIRTYKKEGDRLILSVAHDQFTYLGGGDIKQKFQYYVSAAALSDSGVDSFSSTSTPSKETLSDPTEETGVVVELGVSALALAAIRFHGEIIGEKFVQSAVFQECKDGTVYSPYLQAHPDDLSAKAGKIITQHFERGGFKGDSIVDALVHKDLEDGKLGLDDPVNADFFVLACLGGYEKQCRKLYDFKYKGEASDSESD